MVRLQIQLTPGQREAVREMAHRQQRSEAAVIRDAVDLYLRHDPDDRRRKMTDALESAGRHRSGSSDTSQRHDEYLVKAITGER